MSGREGALLRAVAAGRCQLVTGCELVLLVDGLGCADWVAAHRLVDAGLVAVPEASQTVVPAELTDAGRDVLRRVGGTTD